MAKQSRIRRTSPENVMTKQSRRPAEHRSRSVARTLAVVAAALAAALLGAPVAGAVTTIGTGLRPGLAVDPAGTAYIAWNDGPESDQTLEFCRLPRGGGTCEARKRISAPGSGYARAFVAVSGSRVSVISPRFGGAVPGLRRTYLFLSLDRGTTFDSGRVVGDVVFTDATVGPGDTLSGVSAAAVFQNVLLDGSASSTASAALSTDRNGAAVALLGPTTPLAVFSDGVTGAAQHRRYKNALDIHDPANWTPPADIAGVTHFPVLAGGPAGLFLLSGDGEGPISVRRFAGTAFGERVTLATGNMSTTHMFQDAGGRLHAAFLRDNPRALVYAASDDGVAWGITTLDAQSTGVNVGFRGITDMRVATAADHVGVAVWSQDFSDGKSEIRVATLGPEAPKPPPPPPVTPPLPPPPLAPKPVVKPTPTFTGTGSAKRLRTRVRIKIKGELIAPAGVPDAKACKGTVVVTFRRARKLVLTKTLTIDKRCAFGFTAFVKKSKVKSARKLTLRIQFLGNDVLAAVAKVGSINVKR